MKFSIIIPTYNRKTLLLKCLKSLERQSVKDFEVIVCDDGSTDGTASAISEMSFCYKFTYISIENSGGPAKPRNTAIGAAIGEWICLLDADDLWMDNKLEECEKLLDQADLIYHNMELVDVNYQNRGIHKSRVLPTEDTVYDLLVNFNPIANSSVCLRRSVFNEVGIFNESKDLSFVEDFEYWLRVASFRKTFVYLPLTLGKYLTHPGNSSSDHMSQLSKINSLYMKYSCDLTGHRRNRVHASLSYLSGCKLEMDLCYGSATTYFKKSFLSGTFTLRIKSMLKLILCYAKSCFR